MPKFQKEALTFLVEIFLKSKYLSFDSFLKVKLSLGWKKIQFRFISLWKKKKYWFNLFYTDFGFLWDTAKTMLFGQLKWLKKMPKYLKWSKEQFEKKKNDSFEMDFMKHCTLLKINVNIIKISSYIHIYTIKNGLIILFCIKWLHSLFFF